MSQSQGTQAGQLNTQNQLQLQQQNAQNQLLQQNNAALSPYLTGNQGFTPQQLASMNSQAMNENALQYNGAAQQANSQLAARGEGLGNTPGSGVQANAYGNLQAAKAGNLSNTLQTITQNNAQQALANKFNAASVLSGNAQTYAGNVGTYGAGANNALNALTEAQGNGFQAQFGKALGKGLGAGTAAIGTGVASAGVGNLGSAVSTLGSGNFGW